MNRTTSYLTALSLMAAGALALAGCGTDPGYEEGADVRAPERSTTVDPAANAAPVTATAPLPISADVAQQVTPTVETASREAESIPEIEPAADPHQAFREAESLYARGDRERAIVLLRSSIAARDDFVHAHYLLGLSLRKTGDVAGAEASLRRALELRPSHVRARTNLARVLIDTDRVEEAIDTLDVAFANGVDGTDLRNVRGLARLEAGDLDAAAADFEQAIVLSPENTYALNNLGLTEIRRGRFEAAVGPLQRAASVEDAPAYVFNNLGIALERTGALSQAGVAFDEAIVRGHAHAGVSLARVERDLAELNLARQSGPEASEEEVSTPDSAIVAIEPVAETDDVESLAALPVDSPEALDP